MSPYATLTEGALVAVEFQWSDGKSDLSILDLAPADAMREPWTETCEGCGDKLSGKPGNGIVCGGYFGYRGPCASCWGSGRVLFAFEVDSIAAEFVPAAVAQPWIAQHRPARVAA